MIQTKENIKRNSQTLRKTMTNEERKLWCGFLKKLPLSVKRQKVVGNYILDFYIPIKKIAIELDGSQHYENKGLEYDKKRDEYLKNNGIKVIRYSNDKINREFKAVCVDIFEKINTIENRW